MNAPSPGAIAESAATRLRCASDAIALLTQRAGINTDDDARARDALGWIATAMNRDLDDLEMALGRIGGAA